MGSQGFRVNCSTTGKIQVSQLLRQFYCLSSLYKIPHRRVSLRHFEEQSICKNHSGIWQVDNEEKQRTTKVVGLRQQAAEDGHH